MKTAVAVWRTFYSQTGQVFFDHAARPLLRGPQLLYAYCAITADSECIVCESRSKALKPACALESEFDRYLLALDGCDSPHAYDLSPHLKWTRGECMTVATFFPPATGGNVNQGVRFMGFSLRFLANKNRKRTEKLLRRIKPSLLDSLIPDEPVDAFARMDSELLARFKRAAKHYPELLEQLRAHMNTGEPLGEDFAVTFG